MRMRPMMRKSVESRLIAVYRSATRGVETEEAPPVGWGLRTGGA
jgi:hypothetical protein